jgi:hypothetical protein
VATSEQQPRRPVHRRAEVLAPPVLLADLLEVEPGAEGGAVAGEHDRPDAVLGAAQQFLDEVGLQRRRQRVAPLRPVEGEHPHVPALLDDQPGLPSLRHAPTFYLAGAGRGGS